MKKIIAVLVLAAITLQVMAQNSRNPDLTLDMNFSPADGLASSLTIGSEAQYNRIGLSLLIILHPYPYKLFGNMD